MILYEFEFVIKHHQQVRIADQLNSKNIQTWWIQFVFLGFTNPYFHSGYLTVCELENSPFLRNVSLSYSTFIIEELICQFRYVKNNQRVDGLWITKH